MLTFIYVQCKYLCVIKIMFFSGWTPRIYGQQHQQQFESGQQHQQQQQQPDNSRPRRLYPNLMEPGSRLSRLSVSITTYLSVIISFICFSIYLYVYKSISLSVSISIYVYLSRFSNVIIIILVLSFFFLYPPMK